jgi:hypothetical protein
LASRRSRSRFRAKRARLLLLVAWFGTASFGFLRGAAAEKILAHDGDWEIFTDGRAAAFVSYVHGQGLPRAAFGPDANGNIIQLHDLRGGGFDALAEHQPVAGGAAGELNQGTIDSMRVRSGMIGNTLGFGVRGPVGDVAFTAYIQIWAFIESEAREKNRPNPADIRQGYAKVEGKWGSLLAGRSRALFSRGATDIDVLYGHRFGVGFPGNIDSNGPASGHIGFGVLGSGFAGGIAYATPRLGGFQLTVGGYDPIQLQGAWPRTKWLRPEAEATFEHALGPAGKIVLFGNGAYQKLYKQDSADSTTAGGYGFGGRLELGPLRLGVAGHRGKGLGLNYALEVSDASLDLAGNLRRFDGYYIQTQLVMDAIPAMPAALRKIDLSFGWGITRVFRIPTTCDPVTLVCTGDDVPDANGNIPHSVIKHQMGYSAAIVYHVRPWLHLDLDGFRAEAAWYLGEKQVVYIANSGMTLTW